MAAFARTFILIAAAAAVAAAFGVWHIAHNVCVARGIYLFCFVVVIVVAFFCLHGGWCSAVPAK